MSKLTIMYIKIFFLKIFEFPAYLFIEVTLVFYPKTSDSLTIIYTVVFYWSYAA